MVFKKNTISYGFINYIGYTCNVSDLTRGKDQIYTLTCVHMYTCDLDDGRRITSLHTRTNTSVIEIHVHIGLHVQKSWERYLMRNTHTYACTYSVEIRWTDRRIASVKCKTNSSTSLTYIRLIYYNIRTHAYEYGYILRADRTFADDDAWPTLRDVSRCHPHPFSFILIIIIILLSLNIRAIVTLIVGFASDRYFWEDVSSSSSS